MELQCKERVDFLDALRKSRKESKEAQDDGEKSSNTPTWRGRPPAAPTNTQSFTGSITSMNALGESSMSPMSSPDPSRAPPPLPHRPIPPSKERSFPAERSYGTSQINPMASLAPYSPITLPVPPKKTSRTPSPDKKNGRVMLTTLRGPKDGKKPSRSPRPIAARTSGPFPVSSKAAGLAWDALPRQAAQKLSQTLPGRDESTTLVDSQLRKSVGEDMSPRPNSMTVNNEEEYSLGGAARMQHSRRMSIDSTTNQEAFRSRNYDHDRKGNGQAHMNGNLALRPQKAADLTELKPPEVPAHVLESNDQSFLKLRDKSPVRPKAPIDYPSYRTEFPPSTPSSKATAEFNARINKRDDTARASSLPTRQVSPPRRVRPSVPSGLSRRPVANISSARVLEHSRDDLEKIGSSDSNYEDTSSSHETQERRKRSSRKARNEAIPVDPALAANANAMGKEAADDEEGERDSPNVLAAAKVWHDRVKHIQKHLPKGVDEAAAKQIFNEIVVKGDEVHWADVAGLDVAKKALKEAVVYPFLRPDLFMGLREPARGMLLFGPPGTGKTMLARAVATESRSTFFAISASSLTSKWLGESEKLVRALFALAKALAPSIIFVDEIDSLLSARGGSSEHESTRRIKTEFLIQWSDLQRAAAGSKQSDKEKAEGDASRVLVLAATNMPWAIDEAARRRFVRRQYIPLPEASVRAEQLRTLLGHQKHSLNKKDIQVLVELTDGKSALNLPISKRTNE